MQRGIDGNHLDDEPVDTDDAHPRPEGERFYRARRPQLAVHQHPARLGPDRVAHFADLPDQPRTSGEERLPRAARQLPHQCAGDDAERRADWNHHLPAEAEVRIRPEAVANVSDEEERPEDDGDETRADEPAVPAE